MKDLTLIIPAKRESESLVGRNPDGWSTYLFGISGRSDFHE